MKKTVILAAVVVAAVALAVNAGASESAEFTAAHYPAFVSGGPSESGSISLGFEGGLTAECDFAGLAGEIAEPSSALAVSPGFGGCTAFGFAEGSIEPNGCELVLRPGSGSGDEFTGSLDVSCPAEQTIAVKGGNCEILIGSQTGVGPVTYDRLTAAEPEAVEASFEMEAASGFAYTKTLDGASCPLSGTGARSDGVFAGGTDLQAGDVETFEPIAFGIE